MWKSCTGCGNRRYEVHKVESWTRMLRSHLLLDTGYRTFPNWFLLPNVSFFNGFFQGLSPVNQTLHSHPQSHWLWAAGVTISCLSGWLCWWAGHSAVCGDEACASWALHIVLPLGGNQLLNWTETEPHGALGPHRGAGNQGVSSGCCFRLNYCFIAQLQLIILAGLDQSCNGNASGYGLRAADSPPSASSRVWKGQRSL